jgi:hypothetical protein
MLSAREEPVQEAALAENQSKELTAPPVHEDHSLPASPVASSSPEASPENTFAFALVDSASSSPTQPSHSQFAGKRLPGSKDPLSIAGSYELAASSTTIMAESDDRAMTLDLTTTEVVEEEHIAKEGAKAAAKERALSRHPLTEQQRLRVKCYELDGGSQWNDLGTGICSVVYVEVID